MKECGLEAVQAMERLSLEKKIRAELLDGHIGLSTLIVDVAKDDLVHISGMTSSQAAKERLSRVLTGMSAVNKFELDVTVWIHPL